MTHDDAVRLRATAVAEPMAFARIAKADTLIRSGFSGQHERVDLTPLVAARRTEEALVELEARR
jgi:hypothetical protein